MDTTLRLAIETYSKLSGTNEIEILELLQSGDKVVINSVLMLMECVA